MNLAESFALVAEQNAAKAALFWGDDVFSYADLLGESTRMASRLSGGCQVRPTDRVGIWMKNSPEFVPAVFGILFNGAVVVPINNFLKPDEVTHIIQDAGILVLIADDATLAGHRSRLEELNPGLKILIIPGGPTSAVATNLAFDFRKIQETELALIIYTSGTTGKPKGAMLTHGNLLHNVESCRQMLLAVSFDRFVVLLPMFHSFMMTVGIFLPLLIGGSLVLIKSLHPVKNVIEEIIRREATILPAIPQFFRALAAGPLLENLPLRLCISGAAPLPHEVLREFKERFPIPLLEGYGLSEASPVVSMNPIAGPWKEGSIGVPIPGVEVSIQNEAGQILSQGEIGEVSIRGGNVMLGYWRQPEETVRALRAGWLLTGDIGYQDADGYFFITDRKKDMLLVNGINVYPREIEEALYHFPGIREAAVIGQSDARRGEHPIAFISANDGATLDERTIIHFLRDRLADYKVPRKINVLPALPRNATGKILKTALRQLAVPDAQP